MKPQDRAAFAAYMTDVLAFHKQDATKFALNVWWQACQPFDIEQVQKALSAHTMDPDRGQFPPMPADIVRRLMGTTKDRALIAWGKALDAMQRVGAYQSVVFDDPVIHAVIEDLGGWIKVCRGELGDLGYTEHRFCESYRAYASRPVPTEYPALLVGCHELDNRTAGRRVAPPVLVGDPAKAADVLRLGGTGPKTQLTLASAVMPALNRLEQTA